MTHWFNTLKPVQILLHTGILAQTEPAPALTPTMARRMVARRQRWMTCPQVSSCLQHRCTSFTLSRVEDTQLTSQALNSDGTPRRPMNAFMIFARRRRPQVSAANQTMRTGDISKILSKEWNSMDMVSRSVLVVPSPNLN